MEGGCTPAISLCGSLLPEVSHSPNVKARKNYAAESQRER